MKKKKETNNKVGRPKKFKSSDELQLLIDNYFHECKENDEPMTITGLAIALDTTRETLLDYQDDEEFSDTIKKAKQRCQNYTEKFLFSGRNVVGAIFSLKNNYGWNEESSLKLKGDKENPIAIESHQKQVKELTNEELYAELAKLKS